MNIKRALWMGVLLYIISFVIGIVSAVVLGVDLSTATEAPLGVWLLGIILNVIVVALFTLWYFKDKNTKPSTQEGFRLGAAFVGLAFVIEAILVIPFILFSDSPADITAYYGQPLFWVSIALIILTSGFVAGWLEKKK